MRRALLCAPLCNCRHSLRADDDEGLVEAALKHMRVHHPTAPLEEERVRQIVSTRSYSIEYVVEYAGGLGLRRSSVSSLTEAPPEAAGSYSTECLEG